MHLDARNEERMKNYRYILFDLDGTLTDPKVGITRSIDYALGYYGIETKDLDSLCRFIGPPLIRTFENEYGFSETKAAEAVEKYREYYNEKGIYENILYQGIENMLKTLKEQDKKILLATSKPLKFAKLILEYFNIIQYFDFLSGSEMDGGRIDKCDVIRYAIDEYNISELSDVIMIGDRKYDIEGAKIIGIDSAGVLYGYGSLDELSDAGADYILENVEDICTLLLS